MNCIRNYLPTPLPVLLLGLIFFSIIDFASAQNTRTRIETAYRSYRQTGNEHFLRMQIITDMNFPDFVDGGVFIKNKKHLRSEQILIDLLRAYNRFDLVEKIFFTDPTDKKYKQKFKTLYYETLYHNLKYQKLVSILLHDFDALSETINQDPKYQKNPPSGSHQGNNHLNNILAPFSTILYYLLSISERGPQQKSIMEKIVKSHHYKHSVTSSHSTQAQSITPNIILNYLYSSANKAKELRQSYQSVLSLHKTFKKTFADLERPSPSNTNTTFNTKSNSSTNTNNTVNTSTNNPLNNANDFFNLDTLTKEVASNVKSNTTKDVVKKREKEEIDYLGVVLFALKETTDERLLNHLYLKGYYLSYLELYRSKAILLHPPSPTYFNFRQLHKNRISQAVIFSQAALHVLAVNPTSTSTKKNTTNPSESSENLTEGISDNLYLRKLFYDHNYKGIIKKFTNYQQNDYYLMALAALGRWNEIFGIVQNNSKLMLNYLIIKDLLTNPTRLITRLNEQLPTNFTSWQLDALNLSEEVKQGKQNFTAKEIAQVITAYIFKHNDLLTIGEAFSTSTDKKFLFEYAVASHIQNLSEQGRANEVKKIFRKYFNRVTSLHFQEKLLYYYGYAHIFDNPKESQKIFFRLLSLNPQSSYRFQIDQAFNLML